MDLYRRRRPNFLRRMRRHDLWRYAAWDSDTGVISDKSQREGATRVIYVSFSVATLTTIVSASVRAL